MNFCFSSDEHTPVEEDVKNSDSDSSSEGMNVWKHMNIMCQTFSSFSHRETGINSYLISHLDNVHTHCNILFVLYHRGEEEKEEEEVQEIKEEKKQKTL